MTGRGGGGGQVTVEPMRQGLLAPPPRAVPGVAAPGGRHGRRPGYVPGAPGTVQGTAEATAEESAVFVSNLARCMTWSDTERMRGREGRTNAPAATHACGEEEQRRDRQRRPPPAPHTACMPGCVCTYTEPYPAWVRLAGGRAF
jgi:hypothetical protein